MVKTAKCRSSSEQSRQSSWCPRPSYWIRVVLLVKSGVDLMVEYKALDAVRSGVSKTMKLGRSPLAVFSVAPSCRHPGAACAGCLVQSKTRSRRHLQGRLGERVARGVDSTQAPEREASSLCASKDMAGGGPARRRWDLEGLPWLWFRVAQPCLLPSPNWLLFSCYQRSRVQHLDPEERSQHDSPSGVTHQSCWFVFFLTKSSGVPPRIRTDWSSAS